jgi:hypothetical protein
VKNIRRAWKAEGLGDIRMVIDYMTAKVSESLTTLELDLLHVLFVLTYPEVIIAESWRRLRACKYGL